MNKEMLDHWEFIKKSDQRALEVDLGGNRDRIKKMHQITEKVLKLCEKCRYDKYLINRIFFNSHGLRNYLDPFDGLFILEWIYDLTRKDYTYILANNEVARILNSKYGCKYEIKNVDTLKLNKLLKKEKAKQISEGPHISLSKKKNLEIQKIKSEIREYVKEKVESIDINLRWKYVFFTNDDFNLFLDLMSNFFAGTPYKLPEVVNLMPKCKGRFARVLHTIHKKYRLRTPNKIKDQDFFKIVRTFNLFKELTDSEIYSDISRSCDEI
jgi:hypothetical protein